MKQLLLRVRDTPPYIKLVLYVTASVVAILLRDTAAHLVQRAEQLLQELNQKINGKE